MKWTEFKEAWRKASKTEKQDFITSLVWMFGATALTLLGVCQFAKYDNVFSDDYRYAIGGLFVTTCGLWAMVLNYILIEHRRVDKLKERIKKLEGKEYHD